MTTRTDPPRHTGEVSGALRVRATRAGARTVVTEAYRTAPFHLGRAHAHAGGAELIVQGVGPGYLPGDRLTISLAVDSGACLHVRGQGATRVYPSPTGVPATVQAALTVAAGSRLMYLSGELIPFRDAVLEQVTRIDVASGGVAILGEIVTPGRLAMGEAHAYTRLRLDVEARVDGRLVLLERARLEPATGDLASIGRHGPYSVAGTLYAIGEAGLTLPSADPGAVTWAHAAGDRFTLVRLVGPTVQAVATAMRHILATAT
jgi:urease accessory protein